MLGWFFNNFRVENNDLVIYRNGLVNTKTLLIILSHIWQGHDSCLLFSIPRNYQNLSFPGSRYKGSEKVPPTMQQHCIALWRQWCVAAPNNLQVKWGQNLYEFANEIKFLIFQQLEFRGSDLSNELLYRIPMILFRFPE